METRSQVSILEAMGTLYWGMGFTACGMQGFSSSLQCFKVMSSPHSAQCLHFLHPICSNRGCSGALCTAKDQVCHLFWCFQKEKITIESLPKPLVFNDPSVPFHCVLLERHLIYFKRSWVFSELSLHIFCDISSIPSKANFLAWQATEQCSFFSLPLFLPRNASLP